MRRFINFVTQNTTEFIAKIASALCALSLGFSASGFIIGFSSHLGFGSSSPLGLQGLVYAGAVIVGINAAYRIWGVAKSGALKGLQLMFSGKNNLSDVDRINSMDEVSPKIKLLKILGIVLSFSAGTTYGGLAYLGISHIINSKNLWIEIAVAVITIGSNFIASGALFSYAWIQGLNEKTLFNRQRKNTSKCYVFFKILSSCAVLFGLGCTMTLGSFGLAKSIDKLSDIAKILGSIIAIIGFFGEAPFAIKQGRLLISDVSKVREKNLVKVTSVLIYATNSFAGTYTDIGNFSIPLRIILATGSAYLSLVTSLEETEEIEDEKKLLSPTKLDYGSANEHSEYNA